MADGDYEYDQAILFYAAEDAVVAYAETPEVREVLRQPVTECPGVLCRSDAVLKIVEDAPLNGLVQLG